MTDRIICDHKTISLNKVQFNLSQTGRYNRIIISFINGAYTELIDFVINFNREDEYNNLMEYFGNIPEWNCPKVIGYIYSLYSLIYEKEYKGQSIFHDEAVEVNFKDCFTEDYLPIGKYNIVCADDDYTEFVAQFQNYVKTKLFNYYDEEQIDEICKVDNIDELLEVMNGYLVQVNNFNYFCW